MSLNAWTTTFSSDITHIIFAQFGIQVKEKSQSLEYVETITESFQLPNGPDHFDISVYVDSESYHNHLFMAYWKNPKNYHDWLNHPQVQKWCSGKLIDKHSEVGFFSEVATIPITHFETIHSRNNNDSGVTHFATLNKTKTHAYWGSMRERIPVSASSDLEGEYRNKLAAKEKKTFGKRIRVIAPNNLCLIRTAQDWSHCSEEQKKTYLNLIQPALNKAHRFLENHPEDTGCISARLIQEIDSNGKRLEKTSVIGYFQSLYHLERWTHEHATHKAVFRTFAEMLKRHNFNIDLSLWHEVSVLQSKDLELEYVNCHPKTGFLPFFKTIEVSTLF